MRKKEQWMALLLTGILAFGLTACGTGDKTEQKTPETTAEVADETTKPQETEAAQATEAPEEEPVDDTEGDAASEYVKYYKSVLDTHYDAYKNQWSVKKFQKNKLSLLAAISSKGNPLKEFGYSTVFCKYFVWSVYYLHSETRKKLF